MLVLIHHPYNYQDGKHNEQPALRLRLEPLFLQKPG